MEIFAHKAFLKAYARLPVSSKTAVDEALILFSETRTHPSLRDHSLRGKMKGLRSFSAGFDLRIVYREDGEFITITLLDVGSHNQVY